MFQRPPNLPSLLKKKDKPGFLDGMGMGTAYSGEQLPSPSFFLPFEDTGAGNISLVAQGLGSTTPTFARSSAGTTISSTGLVTSVGSDTARSYYDPTTLTYRGYLAEGARTNLCLQSSDFSTTWTQGGITVTTNTTTGPDGLSNADKLAEDNSAGAHNARQQFVKAASAISYSFSVWAKQSERTFLAIVLWDTTNGNRFWFNLATGAIGSTAVVGTGFTSTSYSIQSYPNGWYRCIANVTSSATALIEARVECASADAVDSYVGTTGNGLFVWGAQLEAGTFPSSYMPTSVASFTRSADTLSYPFASNVNAATGTCYIEASTEWLIAAVGTVYAVATGGVGSTAPLGVPDTAPPTDILVRDGTTVIEKGSLSSMTTGSRKRVSSWGATGQSITGDGLTPATGVFDGDMGSTTLDIGNQAAGGNNWFGTIRNLRIWNKQLTNYQLQLLTR